MKRLFLITLAWFSTGWICAAPQLQNGDIVFQSEAGNFAKAIQLATHSPYNHVGMVFIRNGEPYVFEAVGPVKFTPLAEFARRGINGRFDVKRLKDAEKVLTPEVWSRMQALAKKFKGRGYSQTFDWLDKTMYCSELVWKMYQRTTGLELGKFQKLGDLDLSNPLVKKEMGKRFGKFWPMGLKMISPGAMFESGLLVTVEDQ